MALIQLTSDRGNKPVLVNTEFVRSVATGPRGVTIVDIGTAWSLWVTESVEEIIAKLQERDEA